MLHDSILLGYVPHIFKKKDLCLVLDFRTLLFSNGFDQKDVCGYNVVSHKWCQSVNFEFCIPNVANGIQGLLRLHNPSSYTLGQTISHT